MPTTRTTTKASKAGRGRKTASPVRRAKPSATPSAGAGGPRGAATVAELRRIARAIVTSTSVKDEKRMLALYADSIESAEAGQLPVHGIEQIKQKNEQWRRMVSDSRWHARNLWCDGQTVVIEWEAVLALRSGRKVNFAEIAIHEIRAGKIFRERFYYDPSLLR